jgi:hypothetical protein
MEKNIPSRSCRVDMSVVTSCKRTFAQMVGYGAQIAAGAKRICNLTRRSSGQTNAPRTVQPEPPIHTLPDEILVQILSMLRYKEMWGKSRVCTRWKIICHSTDMLNAMVDRHKSAMERIVPNILIDYDALKVSLRELKASQDEVDAALPEMRKALRTNQRLSEIAGNALGITALALAPIVIDGAIRITIAAYRDWEAQIAEQLRRHPDWTRAQAIEEINRPFREVMNRLQPPDPPEPNPYYN